MRKGSVNMEFSDTKKSTVVEVTKKKMFLGGDFRAWSSLVVGGLMLLVSGSLYSFSSFSTDVVDQWHISKTDADNVVTVGNIGLCIATPVGWVTDRVGTRWTSVIAAVVSFLGFFLVYLMSLKVIAVNAGLLCFLFFIIGQGSIFTYMPAFVTYQNFPERERGKIIGILDCLFGLSALFCSSIYTAGFADSTNLSGFFLTLAFLMLGLNILGALCIKVDNTSSSSSAAAVHEEGEALDASYLALTEVDEGLDSLVNSPSEQPADVPIQQLLFRIDYWMVFLAMFFMTGIGLLFIYQAGFVAESVGQKHLDKWISQTVSLSSSLSRIAVGVCSDLFVKHISRGGLMVFSAAMMLLAQLLLIFFMETSLMVVSVFVGIAFGSMWCLTPLMVSDQYGVKHFGSNWGTIIIASAVSPYVFNFFQAWVYTSHSTVVDGKEVCLGVECYRNTFIYSAAINCLTVAIVIWIALRFRKRGQFL
eukprot:GILK01005515.1.p1 GENE.GILK01005515.1~~GILK01005515.1.p1  ORF type:complete len:475 (+),score=76.38 GILK01005515.1:83-1507(+)